MPTQMPEVCNIDLSRQEKKDACLLTLPLVGGVKREEGIGITPDRK